MLLLFYQYCLSHLQVHLLQARKDLAFLQCPIEVNELSGPEARDVRLSKEVMLDSLGSDATGIPFRAHLSKGALKGYQSILPRAMAPSLLSSSLSWARSYPCSSTTTASEGHGALPQSRSREWRHDKEASPDKHWHRVKTHVTDGDARWEEASVLARRDGGWRQSRRGLPSQGHFVMISTTSQHGQWAAVSFNISGQER
jgi:hypothetical protein